MISPDLQKPFVVHANEGIITVLGTKFNVRAWKQTQKVKVVVAEGKVAFASKKSGDDNAVTITEDQISILERDNNPTKPRQADIKKYISWINNEMEFNNAPLSEIIHQLERWYNLKITFKDDSLTAEHLTVYIKNKPVEEILNLIAILTGTNYKRTGNSITFVTRQSS
jgi:ferric-dicitrate binding protein FerR (iron transport regulator)